MSLFEGISYVNPAGAEMSTIYNLPKKSKEINEHCSRQYS